MASEMQKPSSSSHEEKVLARRVKRGDSKEMCTIPQKEKDTESDMSAIDKLADIAKDKIQELTLENTEFKRNLVSLNKRVLTDSRNGLCELYNALIEVQTFTEIAMGLQDTIRVKEKEAEDMITKVKFIASILHSSTPILIPIMNDCEVYACQDILKYVSASTTTLKTRVEHIKQTVDGWTGKLEKEAENFCIPSLRNSDGKFMTLAEFNQVVDSFLANIESCLQSSERQLNKENRFATFVLYATARVHRIALLRDVTLETILPLVVELSEIKVRVERRFLINTLQIEEDYVSCKEAVEEKLPAK